LVLYTYISYDRSGDSDGEILMVRFTEKDILARKFVTHKARAKMHVSRPMGIEVFRRY
jgi:hypothetical protein